MHVPLTIRRMGIEELAWAAAQTQAENWTSETEEEFQGFYAHAPEGCLVAEQDGRLVGMGVATAYQEVGFLGQIIVAKHSRGMGVGGRMVAALQAHLLGLGVGSIYLDATQAGAPLYERHGFRKLQPSLRFSGTLHGAAWSAMRSMTAADLDQVYALDRQFWGADRRFFLQRRLDLHPALCHVLEREGGIAGFVMARPRNGRLWVGPWVVRPDVAEPERMLGALVVPGTSLQAHAGVLSSNVRACDAFARLAWTAGDHPPWRMVHGTCMGLGDAPGVCANGTSAKG